MEEKVNEMSEKMANNFRDYLIKYLMFNLLRQQGDFMLGIDNFKQIYLGHIRTKFEKKMGADLMFKFLPKEMREMAEAMTIGISEKMVEVFEADMIDFMKEYSSVEP